MTRMANMKSRVGHVLLGGCWSVNPHSNPTRTPAHWDPPNISELEGLDAECSGHLDHQSCTWTWARSSILAADGFGEPVYSENRCEEVPWVESPSSPFGRAGVLGCQRVRTQPPSLREWTMDSHLVSPGIEACHERRKHLPPEP